MSANKKNRTTIKVRLTNILHDNLNYDNLFECIDNSNLMIANGCLFMRSYILHIIENNKYSTEIEKPIIDIKFIRLVFSVLNSSPIKKGRPFDETSRKHFNELNKFFKLFKAYTSIELVNTTNISYIMGQAYEQIYISIINNIKLHFRKHVTKFVRTKFYDEYESLKNNKQKEKLSELKKLQVDIVNDFLSNKTSDNKHKKWIENYRKIIIPKTYTEKTFEIDVKKNTFSYLECMYKLNKYIQKKEIKSYQFFPIRTVCYSKYIKINTSALIDIFCKDKLKLLKKAGDLKLQEELWNKYFKFKINNEYKYKLKGYSFNYEIQTDGFGTSLNFINNDEICKKEKAKQNKKIARLDVINLKKIKSPKQFEKIKKQKEDDKLEKKQKQKELVKQKKQQKKEEFKKLSKLEQEEVKVILNEKSEFPYIEKLLKNENLSAQFKKDFNDGKLILCDPGKRSLLYFIASNKIIHKPDKKIKNNNFGVSIWKNYKILNYTNKTRIKFTKRSKYIRLIDNWKKKKPKNVRHKLISLIRQLKHSKKFKNKKYSILIKELKRELLNTKTTLKNIEEKLANYNSKSCSLFNFLNYVKEKLKHNKKAKNNYDTNYLKKLRWFSYINKCRHEDQLMNIIENEFGSDIKIIIGDWSNCGKLKYISTPNLSLKRKLNERFKVYLIDEYLTSKIHYIHNVRCTNIYINNNKEDINDKDNKDNNNDKNKRIKLHAVLSYKKEIRNGCNKSFESGCINRDKNSVLNMERIVKHLINTGERLSIFRRSNNQNYLNNSIIKDNNSEANLDTNKSCNILLKNISKSLQTRKLKTFVLQDLKVLIGIQKIKNKNKTKIKQK